MKKYLKAAVRGGIKGLVAYYALLGIGWTWTEIQTRREALAELDRLDDLESYELTPEDEARLLDPNSF